MRRRAVDRSRKERSLQLFRGKQMMLLEQPRQQLQTLAAHKHVVTAAARGKHAADVRYVHICKKASLSNPVLPLVAVRWPYMESRQRQQEKRNVSASGDVLSSVGHHFGRVLA